MITFISIALIIIGVLLIGVAGILIAVEEPSNCLEWVRAIVVLLAGIAVTSLPFALRFFERI